MLAFHDKIITQCWTFFIKNKNYFIWKSESYSIWNTVVFEESRHSYFCYSLPCQLRQSSTSEDEGKLRLHTTDLTHFHWHWNWNLWWNPIQILEMKKMIAMMACLEEGYLWRVIGGEFDIHFDHHLIIKSKLSRSQVKLSTILTKLTVIFPMI